ncbi:enoyl-ACP reductase FabV [Vibrio gazogenes]|uniref:trans-2-enoyl-CoA reductase (NAD(+)) n=1 Tax=Vibrio gazogenes DSM 21264 = NBRC 103151 TaxID=1123492 RepID=A0A1M4VIA1_VIBGA|nr:enoyl-ACP reductase FabV [Vibrio gazogenes]USP15533.1 trans-2-enoyl-CoA reductase family protein [Vibrio gazogenes]SHE68766.1 enoyl-[acyl-carrier protein] reductase / trans-2-enoyl-CoA reductase (NAD+) [Vibrio gazogenes DSM 21264] [Vibrio gazogenes DSM 21264 = NBRC 103151]SJN58579.1 Putative reductase [Vibrio gazogenes]
MHITPKINGVVAHSAHPYGCEQSIIQQIQYAKTATPIQHGPKRVLILGASSGLGLAARIALTFGGAEADTIGVSLDKPPQTNQSGNAGFYNNYYFKQYAQREGRTAINIQGDVFSRHTKEAVIEAIETYFEGEVDLIIYSVASGKRRKAEGSDRFWHSAIKPIGQSIESVLLDLGQDQWQDVMLEPALEEEIDATLKVMGGEDWEAWIDTLINAESIADGCQSVAFSYIGSALTHPIYLDGTLGRAKVDLHQTSHSLNLKLANYGGHAYAVVCQALLTRASVFIPGLSPYLIALNQVMHTLGVNENCNSQMQRLFTTKLYGPETVPVDGERLIRLDEHELSPEVQTKTQQLLAEINADNFSQLDAYQTFKEAFMQLNGFHWPAVDDHAPIDLQPFIRFATKQ